MKINSQQLGVLHFTEREFFGMVCFMNLVNINHSSVSSHIMSLSETAFRIHEKCQSFIPISYYVNFPSFTFHSRSPCRSRKLRLLKNFMQTTALFFFIFPLFRMYWLYSNWSSNIPKKPEQLFVNLFQAGMSNAALNAYYLLDHKGAPIPSLFNQLCKLSRVQTQHCTNKWKWKKHAVYLLAAALLTFPTGVFGASFTMRYLPIRLIYCSTVNITIKRRSWADYTMKTVEGLFYGMTVLFPAITVLCIFLILLIFLEGAQFLSKKLLRMSFKKAVSNHQHLRIMIEICNTISSSFLFVLIIIGILLASSGCYIAAKQRQEMSVLTVLFLVTTAILTTVLALGLTSLADAPYRNGKKFVRLWRKKVGLSKENVRILRACSNIGYRVGLMRHARNTLGIIIIDLIVQLTVNIMLIK